MLQIFSTSKPGSGSPVAPSFTWPGIFWGGKGDRKIILMTRIIKELLNLSPDWADGSCPVSGAPSTASAIRGGLPKQAKLSPSSWKCRTPTCLASSPQLSPTDVNPSLPLILDILLHVRHKEWVLKLIFQMFLRSEFIG